MKVRLLCDMCFGGVRHEAGTSIDVSDLLAREMLAQGRVERIDGAAAPPPAPMTTESAAPMVNGKAPKERKHVPE